MNPISNFYDQLSLKLTSIEAKLQLLESNNVQIEERPVNGSELCAYLGISHPTLIARRKKGQIPFKKIGKRYLYLRSEVLKAISSE
jgi:excisionase family DNA binding protein